MKKAIGPKGKNLVFLMCIPRSGSTLLSMMLSAHNKISCPPEPWMILFTAEIFDLYRVRNVPYGRNIAQVAAMDFLYSMENEKYGTIKDVIIDLGTGISDRKNIEKIVREFVRNAYSAHVLLNNKKIFIDKTPRNYAVIPLIDKLYPQSKKIFLKRNPLDIAFSYLSTWDIAINELVGEELTVNSRDFNEGLFNILKYFSKPSDLKHVVAYEDLIADSALEIEKICNFIGVDFQSSMLKYYENDAVMREFREASIGDQLSSKKLRTISSDSIGRGLKSLKKSDLEKLMSILGEKIFIDFGYSKVLKNIKLMGIELPDEQNAKYARKKVVEELRSKEIVDDDRKNYLGKRLLTLTNLLKESEDDRAARGRQIEILTKMLNDSETDRASRGEQILTLTELLKESETDRALRGEQILTLTNLLKESEYDRNARGKQIETLMRMLEDLRVN